MTSALPAPSWSVLVTAWTWQPFALATAALLAGWYAWLVHRLRRPGTTRQPSRLRQSGKTWPARRSVMFAAGIVALLWTTCGFPGAYLDALFWVWTAQQLALLLVVPYLILAGQPLQLAQVVSGANGLVARFLRSGVVRSLANPLIGPALVPLLSVVLFFGPLPGWAINVRPFGWLEELVVLAVGALIVLPLVGADRPRSSLAVGLSLAIGSFELVLDAVPGIALRLHRSLSTSYFDHRVVHTWTLSGLHDQQIAGSILWCTAELLDLPFLVLVFRQWLRADARDAADIDAVLEAERIAGGRHGDDAESGPADQPWWLSDPSMQGRLQRRD